MTTPTQPLSAEELAAHFEQQADAVSIGALDRPSISVHDLRQAAFVLRASAQQEPTEFRAVGWIRPDGSMHKGCPPLNEPDGWSALLVQEKQPPMLNGLTEAETNATASVAGLTTQPAAGPGLTDERIERLRIDATDHGTINRYAAIRFARAVIAADRAARKGEGA